MAIVLADPQADRDSLGAVLLCREFVAPSLVYVLYTSLGASAHATKSLAPGDRSGPPHRIPAANRPEAGKNPVPEVLKFYKLLW